MRVNSKILSLKIKNGVLHLFLVILYMTLSSISYQWACCLNYWM